MKRSHVFFALILAGIAGAASADGAGAAPPRATPARATTVQLRHTAVGSVLASSTGHTLYAFTHDHPRGDSCVGISGCAHAWPAVQTHGKPLAGAGVKASLLGTITIAGGVKQVTYAGHALYMFRGDQPGATEYVGVMEFGGTWKALAASGHMIS